MTEVEQQAPAPTLETKEEVVEEKKVEAEGDNKEEEKKDEEKKEEKDEKVFNVHNLLRLTQKYFSGYVKSFMFNE